MAVDPSPDADASMTLWSTFRAGISERFFRHTSPVAIGRPPQFGLFGRFARDERGSYVLAVALMTPLLIGVAGLGTEAVWWLYKHKNMQSAADSGAVSAATA